MTHGRAGGHGGETPPGPAEAVVLLPPRIGLHMPFPVPWTFASAAPGPPSLPWWLWVVMSIGLDILLVASLIGIWRHLAGGWRRAERELAAARTAITRSSETLRLATELADVGVWYWDPVAGVLTMSDRCKVHFGLPTSQAVDIDRFYAALHPDDRDRVRAAIERSRAERTEFRTTYRAMLPDGSQREFAAMGRFTYDAHGRPLSMGGVTLDVSRIGRLESELRTAEATSEQQTVDQHRLRAQMMSTLNPVVLGQPVRDARGKTVDFISVDFNQSACDFIGLDREHILGKRLVELFPQLKATGLLARFIETADTGRPTAVDDFPFPMEDGEVHRMDIRAVPADEWVSFAWRDNSERYAAMERIAASEERFRLLAENSLDVVVRLDANDKVVWVSPSVTTILGWGVHEVIGRYGFDFLATEETRQQYRRDKAWVFAGRGTVSRSEVRSKTGEVHWMETHWSPFRMPDGRIDGVIVSMRVIDAEIVAERALERRARIDDLTGLLNRKELMDRLDGLVAGGERDFAVLWCDIDRFKEINDIRGHAAGDAVLEALGERIRGCLQTPDDLGGRIGGDELMVVLRGVNDLHAATQAAERLRCAAAEPIPFEGGTIVASLSIGVTLALHDEGVDAILARADDAMYKAKEQGRNRVVALAAPLAGASA